MLLAEQIKQLKKEKDAAILAHYYVPGDVQDVADYVGDSFYLSKIATKLENKSIIFAGVEFMGESAKILNPEKRVFMPDATADCPMAHMIDIEDIEKIRNEYPDVAVVCYINSTAETKTYSDVCVTSSNAVNIVKKLPNKDIFFIPDQHLGSYVAEQVPDKNIILNPGFCPRHHQLTKEQVLKAKEEYPDALFLAHPECPKEVLDEADYIGSTSGIIDYATESDAKEFIIGTVIGVFHELKKRNPDKLFHAISSTQVCVNMQKVTLEKVKNVLETECNEVFVSEELREKAMVPLTRMLEMAK
ncbi:MAG: quinolinate synthase NadA [Clostridia bacterium]|nr:quinolinate synthase NadA [Lachnospiraceae bacterium]NCC02058.1 quinolinate synthase NadA [Clostridia bacterium]NCD03923.1 quinolinate synthase NadA [Clostridia bacterium]